MPKCVLIALAVFINTGYACTCFAPTVESARAHAQIVFRGTITGFREDKTIAKGRTGLGDNFKGIVVFRVSRVWKGDVGPIFEMPALEETSMCVGFWPTHLKVGNDLLVYAVRNPGENAYYTNICTRTALAKDAKEDFDQLGRGGEPSKITEKSK